MDDTPKAFLEELRSSLLKKRVGQIGLAVVLAEAAWRLVTALTWYLIIPAIGKALSNSESVLFQKSTTYPFPWQNLFGSLLEFGLVLILVFYLNRWVQRKPTPTTAQDLDAEYSSTGEAFTESQTGKLPPSAETDALPGAANG